MAKSKGRLLAELLASDGKIKESKSALDISGGKLAPSDIPTLPNSKLENSSITIAGESTALGSSVSLNTGHITEHTNFKYYTEARVRSAISASGDLSYNSSTGVISFSATGAPVVSVNGTTGSVVLDTGDIAESGNLYYTDARVGSYLSTNGYATQSTIVGAITDSAPATLDTLNELAAALGDDANFSTTVTNSIAAKLPLAGGTMTGGTTYNVGGDAITISSGAPQFRFNDTTSGADDFWIHVNSNVFYILGDRDDSGTWETPHPLELHSGTNIPYAFGHRLFTEDYHPNADTLTTARTINGVSFNGSANITVADATKLPLAGGTITGTVVFNSAPTFNTAITMGSTLNVASSIGIAGTTVISSSRVVENVTLKHGTSGSRFQADGWFYDTGTQRARFYFENNGRTFFGSGGGYNFRDGADTTRFTISNNGGLNLLSGGEGHVGSTVAMAVSGQTVIDSSRNLSNIGTISSGAITSSGDILIDSDNAEINLKSGVGTTSGAVNWTFNSTGTNYASIKLPYATRATTGLHIDSGYPITVDATSRIDFDISGSTKMDLDSNGLSVIVPATFDGNVAVGNSGTSNSLTVGGNYGKQYWTKGYSVSNTNIGELLNQDGTSLATGGAYRFTAHIDGTGTDQSSRAVFWNENGTWNVNVTGQSGTSSNHIQFLVSSGVPSVKTYHAQNYTVRVWHERINLNENAGNDNSEHYFGADAYLSKIGDALTLNADTTVAGTISSGAITSSSNIVTTNSSAVIQTPRISMEADGTLDWGSAKNYGTLTWDTNKAIVVAQSGSSLEFKTNNSGLALTLDTSQNATFAGNVQIQTGSSVGKFAVMATSVHGSYDFYNNGTSYFNGAVIVDDALNISGSNRALKINGTTVIDSGRNANFVGVTGQTLGVDNTSNSTKYGISLYGSASAATNPTYGMMFTGTSGSGTHGSVTGDWATYFTMNSSANRGWIFRNQTAGNVASISNTGNAKFDGTLNAGAITSTGILTLDTSPAANGTGDLVIIPSLSSSSGVGFAGQVFGVNIKNAVHSTHNAPQVASTWGGVTGATAIAIQADDNSYGQFQVWTAAQDSSADDLLVPRFYIAGNGNATFTGTITGTTATASAGTNTTALANTAFVQQEITSLIGGAPTALDTLNELAAAINDDSNYNTTLTTALATKLPSASYTAADVLTKVKTVDGSGSGLDADTLDGIQASSFLRSDTADSGGTTTGSSLNIPYLKTNMLLVGATNFADTINGAPWYGLGKSTLVGYHSNNSTMSQLANYWGLRLQTAGARIDMTPTGYAANILFGAGTDVSGTTWARINSTGLYQGLSNIVWHAGNDGSGSGLDADTVDGIQGASFLRSDTADTVTGVITFAATPTLGGTSANEGGEILFGAPTGGGSAFAIDNYQGHARIHTLQSGKSFQIVGAGETVRTTINTNIGTVWGSGNDGSGSGLDADTLDGIQASSFLRSDAADTFSSHLSSANNVSIRFVAANPTDANDGKIAAGLFGTGLNIVGAQTSAGTGRQVRIWGDVITDGGHKYWNANNDGSGSGLDADTLDGNQATAFVVKSGDTMTGALKVGTKLYEDFESSGHFYLGNNDWGSFIGGSVGNGYSATHKGMSFNNQSGIIPCVIPIDPEATYRVKIRFKQVTVSSGSGKFYFGVDTLNEDKSRLSSDTATSYNYGVVIGQSHSAGTVYTYEDTFSGYNATNAADHQKFDPEGKYFNLVWIANYQGSGEVVIQSIEVERLPGSIWLGDTKVIDESRNLIGAASINTGRIVTSGLYGTGHGSSILPIWQYNAGNTGYGIGYYEGNPDTIRFDASGNLMSGTPDFEISSNVAKVNGNTVWHTGNDGSGSGLDADTLDGQHASSFLTGNQTITLSGHAVGSGTTSIPVTVEYVDSKLDANNVNLNNPPNFPASGSRGVVGFYNAYFPTGSGNISNYNAPLDSGQHYHIQQFNGYSTTDALWSYQIAYNFYNQGMYHRNQYNGTWQAWRKSWDSLNDGSGSGLDADLLDGQHGSHYLAWANVTGKPTIPTNNNQLTNGSAYLTASGSITESHRVSGNAFATTGSPGSALEYQQAASITDTKLAPSGDWHNTIRMGHGNPYSYYSNTLAMQMTGTGTGRIRTQTISNNNALGWREVWDSGNDGSGSGLDADLLDGMDSNRFISGTGTTGTTQHTITDWNSPTKSGWYSDDGASNKWSTANWSSIMHVKLYDSNNNYATQLGFDTYNNNLYTRTNNSGTWTSWDKIWHAGVDGAGSGLDADLLDGNQATAFATAAQGTLATNALPTNNPTATGTLVSPIIRARKSQTQGNYTTAALWTESFSSTNTGIAFHISGNVGKMLDMRTDGHLYWENGRVWSATSDGSGSGLDADLLDGQHGSYYQPAGSYLTAETLSSTNTVTVTGTKYFQPAGSATSPLGGGGGASLQAYAPNNGTAAYMAFHRSSQYAINWGLDTSNTMVLGGWSSSTTAARMSIGTNGLMVTAGQGNLWGASNDGSGSGLDADLLDGQHASAFLTSYTETDTLNTVTGRGATTSNNVDFGKVLVGGSYSNNAYNTVSSTRLLFGGGNDQDNYHIGTNLEDYGGNYTKLDLRWHTGIRMGAQPGYGGIRFFNNEDLGSVLFSIGKGDTNMRVEGGNMLFTGDRLAIFGPNTGYSKELAIGGNGNLSTANRASIGVTNGNLHIDAASSNTTYLNFYDGTGGTAFGNGAVGIVAWMGPDGDLWKGSNDNSGSKYWHAGNDGASSGLDADLLDGLHGTSFVRTDTGSTIGNNHTVTQRGQFTTGTSGQNNSTQAGQLNYHYGYQFGGAWTSPFPDLVLGYHTGVRIGGYHGYGGTRFYTDHPSRTTTMLFSVGNGDAHVRANNNIYAYTSDKRLKENFRPIENAVDKVKAIGGFIFDWRKDMMDKHEFTPDQEKDDAGLIAQEVQKVMPAAIKRAPFDHDLTKPNQSKSGEDFLTVQYEKMVPLLVEAIKEQQKQIDELKKLLENK